MKQGSFNQTAYRIFLLIQWLKEAALTYPQINERFLRHEKVKRAVSQDTLWLYINTLKQLGCEISRPSPSNQFTYRLKYHPFQVFLSDSDLQLMVGTLNQLDGQLDDMTYFYLCQWLKRLFENVSNSNRGSLLVDYFPKLANLNLNRIEQIVCELQPYCEAETLLQIYYRNDPGQEPQEMVVLPKNIFHYQGQFYLNALSTRHSDGSMLRLDKITDLHPLEDEGVLKELRDRKHQKTLVQVQILNCQLRHYTPLADEEMVTPDPDNPAHLLVQIQTENPFLVKQKLLASGYLFKVLAPKTLQTQLQSTLEEMKALYSV